MIHIDISTFACTCIGKDKQTTETELSHVDIAVKGSVISITSYNYYDTVSYSLSGKKLDPKDAHYLIRKYKIYTLVIDKKFKATKGLSDTVRVITAYDSGACGYEFEIDKSYIVYGDVWKEKKIIVKEKKRKSQRRVVEVVIKDMFYTDICNLTQESNIKELENLKRLTE